MGSAFSVTSGASSTAGVSAAGSTCGISASDIASQHTPGNPKGANSVIWVQMLGLIAFAGLLIAGFAFMAVMGLVFMVVRVAFWAVFLPFRLLFKLMWL